MLSKVFQFIMKFVLNQSFLWTFSGDVNQRTSNMYSSHIQDVPFLFEKNEKASYAHVDKLRVGFKFEKLN